MTAPTARPLADLHRHLDGSLRPATLAELAEERRRYLPRRLAFEPGMGLADALSRFKFVLDLLQRPEDVRRVAAEAVEDARAEGVTTLELRFAPQLHRDAEPEEVVDAALAGCAGQAGLILCGLYGEHPEVLDRLVDVAASRPGVVGLDLAGGPSPQHRFILEDYAPAFSRARELGLGRTVHAGEGREAEEVAIAIEALHAQRIGHGTTLLDEPAVVDLVVERQVVIEVCVTSNVHTGAIGSAEEHPLPRWLERGVLACLNTDNPFFSRTTAPAELEVALRLPGIDDAALAQLVETGHRSAFRRG